MVEQNDKSKRGERASLATKIGRFSVFAVHTRFDAVQWFVEDVENVDHLGLSIVVGQHETREAAIAQATQGAR